VKQDVEGYEWRRRRRGIDAIEEDRCLEETRSHDTAAERQKRAGMASFRPHARSLTRSAGNRNKGENSTEVETKVT
jgi:hypothetical protein